MKRGRKPLGPRLVGRLDASTRAKRRLETILEEISGKKTLAEACAAIGVAESQYLTLRATALQAALSGLEPGQPGRPSKKPTDVEQRLQDLEDEMQMAKIELQAARIREEIAVTMPHLLRRRRGTKKNS